jgi:hypothetical protein
MPLIAVAVVGLAASELPWSPTAVALLATAVAGFTVWALTDRPHVAPLALLLLAIGLKHVIRRDVEEARARASQRRGRRSREPRGAARDDRGAA